VLSFNIGAELADKHVVIGFVIKTEVLNVKNFVKELTILGQSSIYEHGLPFRIGGADVKTF